MSNRKPLPERLWKYRTWDKSGHTRALLVDGDAYFSRVAELNDPFEFRWRETLPTQFDELDALARDLLAKRFPHDNEAQRQPKYLHLLGDMVRLSSERKGKPAPTVAKFTEGVFCLAERNDNLLMWSHYADCHSGACLGIRTDALRGKRILPVTYSETVPVIDASLYTGNSRNEFVELSLVKSVDWSYEREWRTIGTPGVRRFPGCVDRVVIGIRATKETIDEVRRAVANASHSIEILFAKQSDTYYSLDILDDPESKQKSNRRKPNGSRRKRAKRSG